MAEVEIGLGKSGRRAYGFDDIAIVPSRRTRDPEDVDITWEIDAYRFELPLLASAMDGVVSPATAIEIGRLGGAGRAQPRGPLDPLRRPRAAARGDRPRSTPRRPPGAMQDIYLEPIKPELVTERIRQIRDAGVVSRRVGHAAAHRPAAAPPSRPASSTCSSSRARWCRPSTCPRTGSRSTS